MGLPWFRLDTNFHHNAKVVELIAANKWRAVTVWIAGMAHAADHGTNGYIPEHSLFLIHATRRVANDLVAVGLWHVSGGGWDINGWDEFQLSDESARKRRDRAQKGGLAKAAKASQAGLRSV
jgi:hypothetical protein